MTAFPICFAFETLSTVVVTWSKHLKMDAVVETPCYVELFRHYPVIYVHFVDVTTRFDLSVAGLPILKLKCMCGHVSFLSDLSERGLVFPDGDVLSKFREMKSPCCVYVKSSAVFYVNGTAITSSLRLAFAPSVKPSHDPSCRSCPSASKIP